MSSIHYIYTYNTIQSTNLHYYRFLQGPDTKKEDVQKISDAIKNESVDTRVSLLNYKKNGETFQNEVSSKRVLVCFVWILRGGGEGIVATYVFMRFFAIAHGVHSRTYILFASSACILPLMHDICSFS